VSHDHSKHVDITDLRAQSFLPVTMTTILVKTTIAYLDMLVFTHVLKEVNKLNLTFTYIIEKDVQASVICQYYSAS